MASSPTWRRYVSSYSSTRLGLKRCRRPCYNRRFCQTACSIVSLAPHVSCSRDQWRESTQSNRSFKGQKGRMMDAESLRELQDRKSVLPRQLQLPGERAIGGLSRRTGRCGIWKGPRIMRHQNGTERLRQYRLRSGGPSARRADEEQIDISALSHSDNLCGRDSTLHDYVDVTPGACFRRNRVE